MDAFGDELSASQEKLYDSFENIENESKGRAD